MAMGNSRVPLGAILAAWDQASIARSGTDESRWREMSERIAAAAATYGVEQLLRGTVFLIGGALDQIGTGGPDGRRIAARFTDVLMAKAAQWEGLADLTDFPMVRRVIGVAFEGRDPVAWRDQAGPVPESEVLTMTCALALIADFVDTVDGPGACERALLSALGGALG
ncbi:hypothetical protein K7472_31260 [Streptomyces sp. PTM05]|uniref:TetR family transcriptional regulator n=1 Tax=Streptantibioticus parmotrematis TaxID=2873249 RepID=A0ABS7R1F0_9ACTN|nr:hypothetical protein [Streptantibioticus parmotrematis]MBY8889288.1 hypothetical protein [Streptantibioticus parmotrematis]